MTPDTLELRDDGTAAWSWPETDVDPDQPDGPSWVPAWELARPRMGDLRALMELYQRGVVGLTAAAAKISGELQAQLSAAQDGEADTQVAKLLADQAAHNLSLAEVMFAWCAEVIARVGRPVGEHPRPVTLDDMPAYAALNTTLYGTLTQHWQSVPLGRGNQPPAPPPAAQNRAQRRA